MEATTPKCVCLCYYREIPHTLVGYLHFDDNNQRQEQQVDQKPERCTKKLPHLTFTFCIRCTKQGFFFNNKEEGCICCDLHTVLVCARCGCCCLCVVLLCVSVMGHAFCICHHGIHSVTGQGSMVKNHSVTDQGSMGQNQNVCFSLWVVDPSGRQVGWSSPLYILCASQLDGDCGCTLGTTISCHTHHAHTLPPSAGCELAERVVPGRLDP